MSKLSLDDYNQQKTSSAAQDMRELKDLLESKPLPTR